MFKQLFGWIGGKEKQYAVITVLLACMTVEGIQNIWHQWSIMGEYSNYPLEELVEWIKVQTPKSRSWLCWGEKIPTDEKRSNEICESPDS